jgi:Mrp family chromosome partitioning ATPase
VDAIQDPKLTLDDVIVRCASFSLAVLPAGRPPDAPFELLKSARFEELLTEARRRYDYVVLDTPPLVPVPDCRVIERCVDGVLIVVGAHRTQRRLVEESLAIVDPGKIIGLLFNGDDQALSGSYSGYYARGSSENGHTGGWLARTVRTARRHVDGAH